MQSSNFIKLIILATHVICLALCLLALVSADLPPPATNSTTGDDQCVKLGVYMESLCPDSRRFFLRQLVPTYREIGAIMDLNLVAFGHARTLANNRMICQHGPRECEGNRRMACLLARSTNQSEVVETFGCLFSNEATPKECINKNMPEVNFDDIEKCKTGDESFQLMVQAEKDTGRVSYVPKLTVNGQYSDEIQEQLENDLKNSICNQYKGSAPVACKIEEAASASPVVAQ